MSSPVQDDRDRRAMYAPPWARAEHSDDDARRIQAEIVAAAERLKVQPQEQPARPETRHERGRTDASRSYPPEGQFDLEDAIRNEWADSRLDPVRMAPPPAFAQGGTTLGMLSRLTGAAGFAAIIALFVTGALPLPTININLWRDDQAAKSAEPVVAKPEPAKMAALPVSFAAQAPTAAPAPAAAASSTVGFAVTAPPSAFPPVTKPEAQRPLPAGAPEARVLDFLNRDEIEALLKRGHDLLSSGDISGGRLILTRAAEAGEPRASLALAGTFDPAVMGYLGVVGIPPDLVKARSWYTRAAEQGSQEASRRLERLAAR